MKTIYYTASSLDGWIADDGDSLDWLFQFGNIPTDYDDFVATIGAAAMGARTWRWLWERHFGKAAPEPLAWPYRFPVWVFTHGAPEELPGADLRWVNGDVATAHAAMAQAAGEKDLWVIGGGELAGQFVDAGLLDEMWVTYAPVTLGSGRPLLSGSRGKQPLRVLDVHTFGSAFVQVRLSWRSGTETPRR